MEERKATLYYRTIELKPSTELIPDEYVIQLSKHFYVEIFHGANYIKDADQLVATFKFCKFTVNKNGFDTNENFFQRLNDLKELLSKSRRTAGLFIIILGIGNKTKPGELMTDGDPKDAISFAKIWDPFLKLDILNRKPKLFMFQSHFETLIEKDGPSNQKRLYDVSAPGADLLLISRCVNTSIFADKFIDTFCKLVQKCGKYADLIDIVVSSVGDESTNRPLVVSTLTAKFFPLAASYRDYNNLILKDLEDLLTAAQQRKGNDQ